MKRILVFFICCLSYQWAAAQTTLIANPDIISSDGFGQQSWGDGVVISAVAIDGSSGQLVYDTQFRDEGFGVAGARWSQIDFYQDYEQLTDVSEKIIIDFNGPVNEVVLTVGMMGANEGHPEGETGMWSGYDASGTLIATGVLGADNSNLGPEVKSVSNSYGIYPISLTASQPMHSITIEATGFGYGQGDPQNRNYGENNSDFDVVGVTYTRASNNDNNTPIAVDDSPGPVREDIGLTSFSYDVFLSNDIGDNLEIVSFDFSSFPGMVEDDRSARQFTFRTAVNFNGTIEIPYTITDGQNTSNAVITLTIIDIIDQLTIGNDGPYTTDANQPVEIAISDLLSNDEADNFGSPISIELTSVGSATSGIAAIVGDNIVFTPASDFVGEASFTYNVNVLSGSVFGPDKRVDEGTSEPVIINVEGDIVMPPSINGSFVLVSKFDESLNLQVNGTGNRTSAVVEACDEQGQIWTISDRGNGFHKIINDYAGRALESYRPTPGNGDNVTIYSSNNRDWQQWEIIDAGNGYFQIKGRYNTRLMTMSNGNAVMLDADGSDSQLWKFEDPSNVTCNTNNPPIAGEDGDPFDDPFFRVTVGETLVIPFDRLLANDTDPDGDELTITAVQRQRAGDVEIVGETVEFTGTNAIPGALFTYTLSDGNGGTDQGFVSLNVLDIVTFQAVNDAPGPVLEDIGLTAFSYDVFLANDIGDNLEIESFDFSNFPGTVEDDRSARRFTFRTAVNFNGTIEIPYTITNGQNTSSAVITLTISDVTDQLTLGNDGPFTTDADRPLGLAISDLIANDEASNFGSPITIELTEVGNAVNGTVAIVADSVVFTPSPGFVGAASFTYDVDVLSGSVFGPDKRVDEGTSDPIVIIVEGDVMTPPSINGSFVLVSKADESSSLQVNATGNRTSAIVEVCNEVGQIWTISDRGNGYHKIINDYADRALEAWRPTPGNGDDVTIYESNNRNWQQWEILDAGDGYFQIMGRYNTRLMTLSNGNAIMLDADDSDNQLWRLVDPSDFACTTNNPPIAEFDGDFFDDPFFTLVQGETLVIPFDSLLANDTDPDGDALTIIDVQFIRNGTPAIVGNTVEFTGESASPGALFSYTISDGRGGTDVGQVGLNILEPASLEAVDDGPFTVEVNSGTFSISFEDLLSNDNNPNGDQLTVVSVNVASPAGSASVGINGSEQSVIIIPAQNYVGPIQVPYNISNQDGLTDTGLIFLDVIDPMVQAISLSASSLNLDGTSSPQSWSDCVSIRSLNYDGAASVISKTGNRIAPSEGRYSTQLDYDPVTGKSEKMIIEFAYPVTDIHVTLGNLEISEYQGLNETGYWIAYDDQMNPIGNGNIDPAMGIESGSGIYGFDLLVNEEVSSIELGATAYAHGQGTSRLDNNSDYSLISLSYKAASTCGSTSTTRKASQALTLPTGNSGTEDFHFSAYPNPTDGKLTVLVSGDKDGELSIYNNLGHLVRIIKLDGPTDNQEISIDITDLKSGFYFVKFNSVVDQRVLRIFKN